MNILGFLNRKPKASEGFTPEEIKKIDEQFSVGVNKVKSMSEEEIGAAMNHTREVVDKLLKETQAVDLTDKRKEQIACMVGVILSNMSGINADVEGAIYALRFKELCHIMYSAGFYDGFFEGQPRMIVPNPLGK